MPIFPVPQNPWEVLSTFCKKNFVNLKKNQERHLNVDLSFLIRIHTDCKAKQQTAKVTIGR